MTGLRVVRARVTPSRSTSACRARSASHRLPFTMASVSRLASTESRFGCSTTAASILSANASTAMATAAGRR